jgi:hypothetical protein
MKKQVLYVAHAIPSSDHPRNLIKIGVSSSVHLRLRDLQKCFPFEIRLVYKSRPLNKWNARRLEKLLHCHFKPYRLRGEWFATDLRYADFINSQTDADPLNFPEFHEYARSTLKTLVRGKTKMLKEGRNWREN